MKVYIPTNESRTFSQYFNWLPDAEETEFPNKADLFLFAGGEDVHPYLYGELRGKRTQSNPLRDVHETWAFNFAKKNKIPMLGICRGSQFLTVMAGGTLLQHVDGHQGQHTTFLSNGAVITVTSTHHQMMNPYVLKDSEYKIIGIAKKTISQYIDGYNEVVPLPDNFPEPEIVYYPKINALAIQGHPEQQTQKEYKDDLNEQKKLFNSFIHGNMDKWEDIKYNNRYEY